MELMANGDVQQCGKTNTDVGRRRRDRSMVIGVQIGVDVAEHEILIGLKVVGYVRLHVGL